MKRISRTKLVLIGLSIAAVFCFATYVFLLRPLPPPIVALRVNPKAFYGASCFAEVCLTNFGPGKIWWSGNLIITYETEDGRVVQFTETITERAKSTLPASGFAQEVVLDAYADKAKSWQISADYYHFRSAPVRVEFRDWILSKSRKSRLPSAFWSLMTWIADCLPKSEANTGSVSADFVFTNARPARRVTGKALPF